MTNRVEKHILNTITDAKKIMLIPHQHPDGDTLGSVSAMMEWLKQNGKLAVSFCATPISEKLLFLPHTETIEQNEAVWDDPDIDTVIVFDSGDLSYAGIASHIKRLPNNPTIINIDHHATNEHFGDLNLVRPDAPSTTAILYSFFRSNAIDITPIMATSLLTGLMTDTGNFTNAATNTISLKIGSELILKGGDLTKINQWTLKDRTVEGLKLWGVILERMEHNKELDIVYTHVTQEDIQYHNVSKTEVDGVANFLNTLEDGRAGMVLIECPDGTIKGSFRTTTDHVDVSRFAQAFEGGGHKKAAGFYIAGPIDVAIQTIFTTLRNLEHIE